MKWYVWLVTCASLVVSAPTWAAGFRIEGEIRFQGASEPPAATVKLLALPEVAAPGLAGMQMAFDSWLGPNDGTPVATATLGPKGRFVLEAPRPGLYRVRIDSNDLYPAAECWVGPAGPTSLEPLALEKAQSVSLELRDPRGQPVPGARVRVKDPAASQRREDPTWFWPGTTQLSDAQGTVNLALPKDLATLDFAAIAEGWATIHLRTTSKVWKSPLVLKLSKGRELEVQVVARSADGSKKGVEGAALFDFRHLPLATTNSTGFATLQLGEEVESLGAWDRQGRRGFISLPRTEPLVIELTSPPDHAGKVLDRASQEVVADAWVWRISSTPLATRSTADGSFWLPKLPFEEAPLLASAAGYQRKILRRTQAFPEDLVFALEPNTQLIGRVLDSSGRAIVDAEIFLERPPEMRETKATVGRRAFRRSDSRGRFSFSAPSGLPLFLRAQHPPRVPAELKIAPLAAGATRDDLVLVLETGTKIRGQVLDSSQKPVAAAEILLRPFQSVNYPPLRVDQTVKAQTDANGQFLQEGVGQGRYDLRVRAEGFAEVEIPGIEISGSSVEQDLGEIWLREGFEVVGQVKDPQGEAVAGVQLWVRRGNFYPAKSGRAPFLNENPDATSEVDGTFRSPPLAEGRDYYIVASHPDFTPLVFTGLELPLTRDLSLTLERGAVLAGVVVNGSGEKQANAMVYLKAEVPNGSAPRFARSDEEGAFQFLQLGAGRYRLDARAEGFVPRSLGGLELTAGQRLENLQLQVETGGSLSGRVLDPGGQAVMDAVVWGRSSNMAGNARTDAVGRYSMSGLPDGEYEVVAVHPNYSQLEQRILLENRQDRELDLQFTGGLGFSGRVVDAENRPLELVEIGLTPKMPGSWHARSTFSDPEGYFQFANLLPGNYLLDAFLEGFLPKELEPFRVDEQTANVQLVLDRGIQLRGRILGLELEDLEATTLEARPISPFSHHSSQTRPDHTGSFTLDSLTPGTWRLRAQVAYSNRALVRLVEIPNGTAPENIELDFTRLDSRLFGSVLVDGEPQAGVRIDVQDSTSAVVNTASTDLQGYYALEVASGTYHVTATIGQHLERRSEFPLEGDVTLDFSLVSRGLRGRVLDAETKEPIAQARVTQVGGRAFTATDAEGFFDFGRVIGGDFHLSVSHGDYVTTPITAPADELDAELEILLARASQLVFRVDGYRDIQGCLSPVEDSAAFCNRWVADDQGQFRVRFSNPGVYWLRLQAEDNATNAFQVQMPGDAGRLALSSGGSLDIWVPEARTQESWLQARDAAGNLHFDIRSGYLQSSFPLEAGRLSLHLPAGSWRLEATVRGTVLTQEVIVLENSQQQVEMP